MAEKVLDKEIILYGTRFPIIGEVQPQVISQFPGKVVIGDVSRSDQQLVSEWVISDQRGGLGIENMDEKQDMDRFWDSQNLWTLDSKAIYLAPLAVQMSTPGGRLRKLCWLGGKLYALGTDPLRKVYRYNTVTAVWDDVCEDVYDLTDAVEFRNSAGTVHYYVAAGARYWRSATGDPGSWAQIAVAANSFAVFDNKLIATDDTYVKYSTDGTTWKNIALLPGIAVTISGLGAVACTPVTTIRSVETREEIIVLLRADGVYVLDFWTGATYKLVSIAKPNVVYSYRDELYVGADSQLLRIVGNVITSISVAGDDGTAIRGSSEFNTSVRDIGAYGDYVYGAIGYNLLIRNGQGWHNLAYPFPGYSYAGVLSVEAVHDGSSLKVYFITYPPGLDDYVSYITMPFSGLQPIKESGIVFSLSGELITPYFDGGFNDWIKVALAIKLTCRQMTATETITVNYRKDTESAWTTLGTVNANGVTVLSFNNGSSQPVGIELKKIQFRFIFGRSGLDNTKTPIMESAVLRYYCAPNTLYGWRCTVDCTHEWKSKTPAELITALETAIDTKTLGVMSYFPDADKYVKILNMVGAETTGRGHEGKYQLTLAEMA
ncbi:MAG: hypothetical protein M1343_02960 [Chloroflexi bacterium]|nr:hypothetical protein [Chloroflexota bacterium]